MKNQHHIHHYHRHIGISYASSIHQRLYSLVVIPLVVLVLAVFIVVNFSNHEVPQFASLDWIFVSRAIFYSFSRLVLAYVLALVIGLLLAVFIDKSPRAEKILLPLFDVLQSVPVLAFFPVVIIFFVHYGLYNWAAIFILFVTMMWSIIFSVVGGLKGIPQDIKDAARVFGISGQAYLRKILLPAVFPYIVTGSLLAWAAGWNVIIVAEVLHTYLPGSLDLFGIGSLLVSTSASGQQQAFFMALIGLIAVVAILNLFVWQKLLKQAEKYKFE